MTMTSAPGSVGEVIESSTARFRAQSHDLNQPPPFGAFVRVGRAASDSEDPFESAKPGEGAIYAVVCWAQTGSLEPGRRAAAYGLHEEDLRREQPQVFELLATEYDCLVIGHASGGEALPYLPQSPARLHAQVSECTPEEIRMLTRRLDFLRTIALSPDCKAQDELLAAVLRIAASNQCGETGFPVRAGKELALILRDDYERLAAILRKLEVP